LDVFVSFLFCFFFLCNPSEEFVHHFSLQSVIFVLIQLKILLFLLFSTLVIIIGVDRV